MAFDDIGSDEEEDRLIDELMDDAQDFDEADEQKRESLSKRTSILSVASKTTSMLHPEE